MIELVPASTAVARAVLSGKLGELSELARVADWPHQDTADALRPLAEHPEHAGEGTFLICRDGAVVGECGWFGPPNPEGEVEIGYGVARSARGQGVGSAAVSLLVDWVTAQGAQRVRAEVLPGNAASLRLLTRLGFEVVDERAGHVVLNRPPPY